MEAGVIGAEELGKVVLVHDVPDPRCEEAGFVDAGHGADVGGEVLVADGALSGQV